MTRKSSSVRNPGIFKFFGGFVKSPLSRISFGLVMLTVSLLLVCDMIGLFPDVRKSELDYRVFIAESIAVQLSLEIDARDRSKMDQILLSAHKRNERIESIAVRRDGAGIVSLAGEHGENWFLPLGEASTVEQVRVALYSRGGSWGVVELAFKPLSNTQQLLRGGGSLGWIILYVGLAGFIGYYLFLRKVLKELDPSHVLPDRVRTALDTLAEGLLILDQEGVIMFCNRVLAVKLGMEPEQLVGKPGASLDWRQSGTGKLADSENLPWMQVLEGLSLPQDSTLDLAVAGQQLHFAINASAIEGPNNEIRGALVTLADITEVEKKRSELQQTLSALEVTQQEITRKNEELFKLATRDSLTDVLNRRAFFEAFEQLFAEAEQTNADLGCIMVDIDKFKNVNDNFGHSVGDTVIRYLSSVMQNHASDNDIVGRFGGEEFCMLLPDGSLEESQRRAEKMRQTIERSEGASFSDKLTITSSFGVSALPSDADTPHELLDRADKALYHAKENGRNQVAKWHNKQMITTSNGASDSSEEFKVETAVIDKSAEIAAQPIMKEAHGERADVGLRQLQGDEKGAKVIVDSEFSVMQRHMLLYNIDQAIHRAQNRDSIVAVFVLDGSALQRVAEAASYHTAMKLGSVLVDRLKNILRSRDVISQAENPEEVTQQLGTVARTDTNAIAVLVSDIDDVSSIPSIVHRVLDLFKQSFVIEGSEYVLETNLGISVQGVDGSTAEQILQNACVACSDSRNSGKKNSYRFFSRQIDQAAKRELRLQSDLPQAIAREELTVMFQAKVSLADGSIAGFEALLRWQHPALGAISPVEFIPLAEKSEMIGQINQWAIAVVADQLKVWQDLGQTTVSVAVNISPVELRDTSLADRLIDLAASRKLLPGSIEIEITESLGIESMAIASETLERLNKAGFLIAIDDFGTGYASLNYLQRFPIERVKIDKSFVDGIASDLRKRRLIKAIISLSASLGMRVLAEGVETEEQLSFLKEYHCDEIQGYIVSRPVKASTATALLHDQDSIRQTILAAEIRGDKRHQESTLSLGGLSAIVSEFPAATSASNDPQTGSAQIKRSGDS